MDLDGALAQMGTSFVDVRSPTQADEELYAAASHGRNHRQTSASGTDSANQQQVLPLYPSFACLQSHLSVYTSLMAPKLSARLSSGRHEQLAPVKTDEQ